jgi:pimeloyl-ACP methyl ester carboxylesterase
MMNILQTVDALPEKTGAITRHNSLGRRILRWLGRGILGLVISLAALIVSGITFESVMLAGDAERYLPTGQIIEVEGYAVHFRCVGEARVGQPTVVMIGGAIGLSYQDLPIQERVSQFARTCVYDRAGYLWSDARPEPRTAWQLMAELRALLHAIPVAPPYVLVGASNGGIYARAFHYLYPDEVAAIVLLDANSEQTLGQGGRLSTDLLKAMGRVGLFRLFPGMICPPDACDPAYAEPNAVFRGYGQHLDTYEREAADGLESPDQIALLRKRLGTPGTLGNMPLLILHANQARVPLEAMDSRYRDHVERYRAYHTALSSRAQYWLIESGHGLAVEQPARVVEAIHAALAEVTQ